MRLGQRFMTILQNAMINVQLKKTGTGIFTCFYENKCYTTLIYKHERIFDQIKELNFHFPKSVSLLAQELILKLCSRTAEERISADE
ncbi:hypothetical protein PFTANZ_06635, partial [Plasmodium falciparum Tanzania (2000708)]